MNIRKYPMGLSQNRNKLSISNTQADAHEILRYAQNDITF